MYSRNAPRAAAAAGSPICLVSGAMEDAIGGRRRAPSGGEEKETTSGAEKTPKSTFSALFEWIGCIVACIQTAEALRVYVEHNRLDFADPERGSLESALGERVQALVSCCRRSMVPEYAWTKAELEELRHGISMEGILTEWVRLIEANEPTGAFRDVRDGDPSDRLPTVQRYMSRTTSAPLSCDWTVYVHALEPILVALKSEDAFVRGVLQTPETGTTAAATATATAAAAATAVVRADDTDMAEGDAVRSSSGWMPWRAVARFMGLSGASTSESRDTPTVDARVHAHDVATDTVAHRCTVCNTVTVLQCSQTRLAFCSRKCQVSHLLYGGAPVCE